MSYSNIQWKNICFSRRAFVLLIIKCILFFIIAARLFFLQIIKSKEYKTLSDYNRIKFLLIEPKRGLIFDKNNIVLAENKINYSIQFYKQRKHDFNIVLKSLFQLLELTEKQKNNILIKARESSYIYPISIEENLSWVQVTRIKSNAYKLPGVYINKGYRRSYPLSHICAHVVGYVGTPGPHYAKEYKLYHNKDFKIGKSGIEKAFDKDFIGSFGNKKIEINARRVIVREISYQKSLAGQKMHISIDSKLQQFIYDKINNVDAGAIVMDVKTGCVLSMVSTPSFDPNIFTSSISQNDWNKIIKNKSYPLTNKVISKLYPPGSIWKIIVALAILNEGIDPNKKIYCSGSVDIGNRRYKCWKHSGHGYVDLNRAIACSCNSYFYELAPIVGINKIHYIAHMLGFGNKIGIEIPGEVSGINPDKHWKKTTYKEDWIIGDTINACIGQGFNSVTLLQLVTMISRIASGLSTVPTLRLNQNTNTYHKPLEIRHSDLILIRDSLSNVFNKPYGIASNLKIQDTKMQIAGKTGTAQIISQDASILDDKRLRSHSIFTGFAPIQEPLYSIAIVVDNAGWGAKTAAPLARDILYFVQKNL